MNMIQDREHGGLSSIFNPLPLPYPRKKQVKVQPFRLDLHFLLSAFDRNKQLTKIAINFEMCGSKVCNNDLHIIYYWSHIYLVANI